MPNNDLTYKERAAATQHANSSAMKDLIVDMAESLDEILLILPHLDAPTKLGTDQNKGNGE